MLERDVWCRIQQRERSLWVAEGASARERLQFAGAALTLLVGIVVGAHTVGLYQTKADNTLSVFSAHSPYLIANFVSGAS